MNLGGSFTLCESGGQEVVKQGVATTELKLCLTPPAHLLVLRPLPLCHGVHVL